jgi:hypothetical protein
MLINSFDYELPSDLAYLYYSHLRSQRNLICYRKEVLLSKENMGKPWHF